VKWLKSSFSRRSWFSNSCKRLSGGPPPAQPFQFQRGKGDGEQFRGNCSIGLRFRFGDCELSAVRCRNETGELVGWSDASPKSRNSPALDRCPLSERSPLSNLPTFRIGRRLPRRSEPILHRRKWRRTLTPASRPTWMTNGFALHPQRFRSSHHRR
jgi:hypothetical protein